MSKTHLSVYTNPSEKRSNRSSSQKHNLIFPKNFESILKKVCVCACVCLPASVPRSCVWEAGWSLHQGGSQRWSHLPRDTRETAASGCRERAPRPREQGRQAGRLLQETPGGPDLRRCPRSGCPRGADSQGAGPQPDTAGATEAQASQARRAIMTKRRACILCLFKTGQALLLI